MLPGFFYVRFTALRTALSKQLVIVHVFVFTEEATLLTVTH